MTGSAGCVHYIASVASGRLEGEVVHWEPLHPRHGHVEVGLDALLRRGWGYHPCLSRHRHWHPGPRLLLLLLLLLQHGLSLSQLLLLLQTNTQTNTVSN